MRARYSAYVLGDEGFLLRSWHGSTRPGTVGTAGVEWLGLDVVSAERGTAFDREGTVTFSARFRRGDSPLELQETSSFVREDGIWYYVDGSAPPVA